MAKPKSAQDNKLEIKEIPNSNIYELFLNGRRKATLSPTPNGFECFSQNVAALRFKENGKEGFEVEFSSKPT